VIRDAFIKYASEPLSDAYSHAMNRRSFRSPLARALGLGSAKSGVRHWRAERVTAVALVPLCLWFAASIIAHTGTL
jgi:succinate dehydrogenase / fumarate reductase membrane anchor subunit